MLSASRATPYDMFTFMRTIERISITLTAERAETVRGAAQAGAYASSREIVREAPRAWRHKRALQARALWELRATVQEGLAGIEAGRVHDLDAERIVVKGEAQLQGRVVGSRTS